MPPLCLSRAEGLLECISISTLNATSGYECDLFAVTCPKTLEDFMFFTGVLSLHTAGISWPVAGVSNIMHYTCMCVFIRSLKM